LFGHRPDADFAEKPVMFANITWPSLVYYHREHAWWVIVTCIAIEFMLLRWSLKTTAVRAFGVVVAINLFSALMGTIPCVPWESDFPFEHPAWVPPLVWAGLSLACHVDPSLGLGGFNIVTWSITILCAAILSTLFEGLLLLTLFYRVVATRRCLLWLTVANLASAFFTYVSIEVVWPRI
jgi:hypothetical protein